MIPAACLISLAAFAITFFLYPACIRRSDEEGRITCNIIRVVISLGVAALAYWIYGMAVGKEALRIETDKSVPHKHLHVQPPVVTE